MTPETGGVLTIVISTSKVIMYQKFTYRNGPNPKLFLPNKSIFANKLINKYKTHLEGSMNTCAGPNTRADIPPRTAFLVGLIYLHTCKPVHLYVDLNKGRRLLPQV